ncbi:5'-phosphate synthase pdxT subunit [Ruminiclostridium sufflavum DSM 19573]|uniref:Pyridoxal 5'-phosphate synthase subunit PdxT n=1 Tax=Ruminiclostridium sufflavum DSM 19573 TaxID=1121337 RepID=A0A318XIM0_9FIRM|nr:pyridoxal 5'-phosphate synthase glutaminase subunit PdxT [Ruminiclostridium sufflavum]PYG86874.1 5'-phosphate synthase pdxT subunit [Ruminiclostridium sufflavum DSM 19573]
MKKIGVLSLQGAVSEHIDKLGNFEGIQPCAVKYKHEIEAVDALIIPGGESTAIGKLLSDFDLSGIIKSRILAGMPVWGTCAGMVILAKKIRNDERRHLEVMDIEVMRNGYGRQIDSFSTSVRLTEISQGEIPLVFIRAPYVVGADSKVKVLLRINENIVACRQDNMLATSFHPELTEDLSFHRYFAGMCG